MVLVGRDCKQLSTITGNISRIAGGAWVQMNNSLAHNFLQESAELHWAVDEECGSAKAAARHGAQADMRNAAACKSFGQQWVKWVRNTGPCKVLT